MTVEAIRAEREANEATAAIRAAALRPGLDLYADSKYVMSRVIGLDDKLTTSAVIECESHWNACLVLLAYGKD